MTEEECDHILPLARPLGATAADTVQKLTQAMQQQDAVPFRRMHVRAMPEYLSCVQDPRIRKRLTDQFWALYVRLELELRSYLVAYESAGLSMPTVHQFRSVLQDTLSELCLARDSLQDAITLETALQHSPDRSIPAATADCPTTSAPGSSASCS